MGAEIIERVPEPLSEARYHHAEAPIWDAAHHRLLFVDMLAGDLLIHDPREHAFPDRRIHVAELLAVVRPRRHGGWVACSADSILLLDEGFRIVDTRRVLRDGRTRFNEGGCDAFGHFYAGTMAYDKAAGAGALHRIDPALTADRVLDEVTVSNGTAPGAEPASLLYIDSARQSVDLLRFDETGRICDRATVVDIDPALGSPDGMTTDTDGGIWVALFGGGAVHRYSSTGELTHVITLPTPQVTAVAMGGTSGSTLFITTSQIRADPADPFAGAVFHVETSFTASPEQRASV